MGVSGFVLESPLYQLLLCLPVALLASWWVYFKNKNHATLTPAIRYTLAGLRFFTILVVCILLLSIFLKSTTTRKEKPLILVATDVSESMLATKDSVLIRDQINTLSTSLQKLEGEDYQVRFIHFGSAAATQTYAPKFTDKETDIHQLFESVNENYANQNIGALVLITDGLYNKGLNPIYSIGDLNFPVYTIGTGDTTTRRDAALGKTAYNEVVTAGNDFMVETMVQAKGCANETLALVLRNNGLTIAEKKIKITSDNFSQPITFTLTSKGAGLLRYELRLEAPSQDANLQNNYYSFAVEALDNKEKILVVAHHPHPDLAALREVLTHTETYDVKWLYQPTTLPDPKAHSLVIFHSLQLEDFQYLNSCREQNIPTLIINPQVSDLAPFYRLQGSVNRTTETEGYLNKYFTLFTLSEAAQQFTRLLPAVDAPVGSIKIGSAIEPLIQQKIGNVETSNPIFCFYNDGQEKSAFFIGDGLWRWKMRDFEAHGSFELFQELIGKSIQWLVLKNDKSPFRIQSPRLVHENDQVVFNAEVYNPSYELITDPDVTITITDEKGKTYPYTFSKQEKRYYLDAGLFNPGTYSYTAKVSLADGVQTKQGSFIVSAIHAELLQLEANHLLLRQIADKTKGKFLKLSSSTSLPATMTNSQKIKTITYSEHTTEPLITFKLLFWTLLILLTVEWFLRKQYLPI